MALVLNSNNTAFDAIRNLELTSTDFAQAVQRLSSGLRINSAADDPSGLAIAESLMAQANGWDQVQRNMQDGVALLQAANAGLTQTQSALQRMDQLAIQAANGTLSSSDLMDIQSEIRTLIGEINQVARQTQFNGRPLLDGSAGGATVSGGGPDVSGITAQAGVTPAGTYTVTQPGSQQAIESAVGSLGSVVTAGSSITIRVGSTSATITAPVATALTQFVNLVNTNSTLQGKVAAGLTSDNHLVVYALQNGADTTSGNTNLLSVYGAVGDFAGANYKFSTSASPTAGATTASLAAYAQGSVQNGDVNTFSTNSAPGGAATFSAIEAQTTATPNYNSNLANGSTLQLEAGNGVVYTFTVVTGSGVSVAAGDASYNATTSTNMNGANPTVNTFIDAVNAITTNGGGGPDPLHASALDAGGGVIAGGSNTAVQSVVINNTTAGILDSTHTTAPAPVAVLGTPTSDFATGGAIVFDKPADANNSVLANAQDLLQGRVLSATNPTNFLAVDAQNELQGASTRSAFLAGNVAGGSVFTQNSSITITGGLASATFTATTGETLAQFFQQVNDSAIGATIGIDTASNKIIITNNNYGGLNQQSGLQASDAPAQVNVSAVSGDFATTGLDIGFVAGSSSTPGQAFTPSANQGSVDASGTFTAGVAAVNGALQLNGPNMATTTLYASGNNATVVNSGGSLPGLQITLGNPGTLTGGDTFSVAQSSSGLLELQTGPDSGNTVPFSIGAESALALGVGTIDVTTQAGAESAITAVQNAISRTSSAQANLGALQNSLTDTQNNASLQELDLLRAHSNLVDANIPQEAVRLARDLILLQTGAAVLAQANQEPGILLRLLLPNQGQLP